MNTNTARSLLDQEKEPDKNEPDDEEVLYQAVTKNSQQRPARKQNSRTEQNTWTSRFILLRSFLLTAVVILSQIPGKFHTGNRPSTTPQAVNYLDFVMHI
jgi:hypothetical protein